MAWLSQINTLHQPRSITNHHTKIIITANSTKQIIVNNCLNLIAGRPEYCYKSTHFVVHWINRSLTTRSLQYKWCYKQYSFSHYSS